MTEDEEWKQRRVLSPLDNEALGRFFTRLAKLSADDKTRVQAEFDKHIQAGERPKVAVQRALALL